MFPKLRTLIAFFFATMLLTTCLANVGLWAKSWAADLIEIQGVTCDDFNGIKWCTLPQENSSVDLLTQVNEPLKCMRAILMAPKTMTYGTNCSTETAIPATCALYLREAEHHYCAFAIHMPQDWVPSKATVTIWTIAYINSIIAMIHIFRHFRKPQATRTLATIPQQHSDASTPRSHAAVGIANVRRSYRSPSIWTRLWARKSGFKVDGLGGY